MGEFGDVLGWEGRDAISFSLPKQFEKGKLIWWWKMFRLFL